MIIDSYVEVSELVHCDIFKLNQLLKRSQLRCVFLFAETFGCESGILVWCVVIYCAMSRRLNELSISQERLHC